MMKFEGSIIFAVPALLALFSLYPDQLQLARPSSCLLSLITL